MTTATKPARRNVQFSLLSEIQADVDQLLSGPHATVGKWSFAQILDHLSRTINAAFDGFRFKAPWVLRVFIAPFIKNSLLTKKMRAGFKLPESANDLLPDPNIDLDTAAEQFRRALARFDSELPQQPSPVFGKMTREEWVMLTLRHCELHLSFVVPA